ncbi:hypothetical protein F7725_011094 [Dissostichus mawsoni]|uniref:Uncharacterized protein n=1 Tax=Dissostichus mawsoni TaxID=36200 RepID=A0A7J5Z8L5_DISMA|nr:hypothetical protein F7725_011094 [Dissostichus mawsoni]
MSAFIQTKGKDSQVEVLVREVYLQPEGVHSFREGPGLQLGEGEVLQHRLHGALSVGIPTETSRAGALAVLRPPALPQVFLQEGQGAHQLWSSGQVEELIRHKLSRCAAQLEKPREPPRSPEARPLVTLMDRHLAAAVKPRLQRTPEE